MNDVSSAANQADAQADAQAAEAVERHHAQMAGALVLKVDALSAAARDGRQQEADDVRADLVGWCRTELVPHALAEEATLYRAAGARPEGRLLVEAMLAEHQVIIGLVDDLERAGDTVTAAGLAQALHVLFTTHLAKENEQILPLLVAAPDVSVATLLGGMHELLGGGGDGGDGGDDADASSVQVDPAGHPELDARSIPHAIRHAAIFGALGSVRPGQGLVLVAPHDPLPLLAQLERREPGTFVVEYLERGPDAWRLAILRRDRVPSDV